jgi:alpha-ketoglutarate-dependent taurine dioxygenase
MKVSQAEQADISPARVSRRAVNLSQEAMVRTEVLYPESHLPLVISPAQSGMNLVAWAANNRDSIEANLFTHGGILLRGFDVKTAAEFEQFGKSVCGELLDYHERSSPRTEVSGHIYSSTDYPADQSIFLHNENSYQDCWPLKIIFFCQTPADQGGETPIADCRKVFQRIDPKIRERFTEKKWMYVRNFGNGFGLDWQTVFQTTDKAVVEEHCRRSGIEFEWKDINRLRTRAVRPAVAIHPRTKEASWFNHATFFHVSTLEPTVSELFIKEFAEEDLPTNTFYGDGSRIEPSVLDELRQAYLQETILFRWQAGDILMLDNMLTAHGRRPFSGARRILVAMAEPITRAGVQQL